MVKKSSLKYRQKLGIKQLLLISTLILFFTLGLVLKTGGLRFDQGILSEKDKENVLATNTWVANFTNIWDTTAMNVYTNVKVYSEKENTAVIEVAAQQAATPVTGSFVVPKELPNVGIYSIAFDVKSEESPNYNMWIKLGTNLTKDVGYFIAFNLQTQILEIKKGAETTAAMIFREKSSAIKTGNLANHVVIRRNNTNGTMDIYFNGMLAKTIVDRTYFGGMNRLYVSSYATRNKVMFTDFKITTP